MQLRVLTTERAFPVDLLNIMGVQCAPMSTTAKQENAKRFTIDLDASLSARVDEHLARLVKKADGVRITPTDAIRNLITRGLAEAERAR